MKTTDLTAKQRSALLALLAEPADNAETKPKRKRRSGGETVKYFTEDEIARFFAAIKPERDAAMFRVAYHRGLRATEIGNLQFSSVDWRTDRIRIDRLKGSASGEFHLCSSEVRALRKWRRIRGDEPGPLFPSRQSHGGGKGISQQMLDRLMKRYGKAAGIPPDKCHAHALKHSCGTHLMNRGESIEDVQDHLGHVNIQSTLVYSKFSNKRRTERDRRLREW